MRQATGANTTDLRLIGIVSSQARRKLNMRDYWKDLYDTVSKKPGSSLLEQVGKTLNGKPLPDDQVELIAWSAAKALKLTGRDLLIDLCCGNGLITERVAPLVSRAWAVDFSKGLIEVAKRNSAAANIKYAHADVLNLDAGYFAGHRKVLMNESLQHFSESDLRLLLEKMSIVEEGSLIYFAGIPDREKLGIYYDTPEKMAFYESREQEGRPHMGRWWLQAEICAIASSLGFRPAVVPQQPSMVTSYYRFDVLLEK